MSNQKHNFLNGEGDSWIKRNFNNIENSYVPTNDAVIHLIQKYKYLFENCNLNILEIGCGGGNRLSYIQNVLHHKVFGIDPSANAIDLTKSKGLSAQIGTADKIEFNSNFMDIVIFGFCLYLCDREDLFDIAREANRVLKPKGLIILQDFYRKDHQSIPYHHKTGLFSFKMDYRQLWTWHPGYECISHEVVGHKTDKFIEDKDEWVAFSVLLKNF